MRCFRDNCINEDITFKQSSMQRIIFTFVHVMPDVVSKLLKYCCITLLTLCCRWNGVAESRMEQETQ